MEPYRKINVEESNNQIAPVSMVILSYNQELYIREAVLAALDQDCEPIEIVISDDCSSDHTFDVIKTTVRLHKTRHKVVLNRNPSNLGIGNHLCRVMEIATGRVVVACAGDDISEQNRVRNVSAEFARNSNAMVVHSDLTEVDEHGVSLGTIRHAALDHQAPIHVAVRSWVPGPIGASMAWRRELFDVFGRFVDGVVTEDRILAYRACLIGEIVHIPKTLVRYRRHTGSISRVNSFDPKVLLQRRVFWLKSGLRTLENYEEDLGKIQQSQLEGVDSGKIMRSIAVMRSEVNSELRLLEAVTTLERIQSFIRGVVLGISPRKLCSAMLLSALPNLYGWQLGFKQRHFK